MLPLTFFFWLNPLNISNEDKSRFWLLSFIRLRTTKISQEEKPCLRNLYCQVNIVGINFLMKNDKKKMSISKSIGNRKKSVFYFYCNCFHYFYFYFSNFSIIFLIIMIMQVVYTKSNYYIMDLSVIIFDQVFHDNNNFITI